MQPLTHQQVDYILQDLQMQGIESEDLRLSLLDHICTIVEEELAQENDFVKVYKQVLPRFFNRELKEIQIETNLLLTFKHYYAMKRTMMISGALSALTFVLGSFFKIMHWPGASVLLCLAVLVFSFGFLPILFLIKTKESVSSRDKVVLFLATMFGILVSLASLFKVMHWPGANMLWISSLGILVLLFLPVYYLTGVRNPETKLNTIISSILILVAGGILFMLTNLRNSAWLDFGTDLAEQRIYVTRDALNETVNASIARVAPDRMADAKSIQNDCDQVYNAIEGIKQDLVQVAVGDDTNISEQEALTMNKGNFDLPVSRLFDKDGKESPLLQLLNANLLNLRKNLQEKHGLVNPMLLKVDETTQYDDETMNWNKTHFYHLPFDVVMKNLTQLQIEIRLAEMACIK